jgi:hypothetical protein
MYNQWIIRLPSLDGIYFFAGVVILDVCPYAINSFRWEYHYTPFLNYSGTCQGFFLVL